jgi:hypothetical protein
MIYWATVGLAAARGGRVELFDLRLAAALAGTLGVLATYVLARGLLRPVRVPGQSGGGSGHIVGARWAAVFLATGVLYFRSARIGELDILLAPSVVGAIGCIWMAWRRALEREETERPRDWIEVLGLRGHWPAVLGAAGCASVAALTKGPPALMVIALGGYGGIVLWICLRVGPVSAGRARLGALAGGVLFALVAAMSVKGAFDAVGVVLIGLMGGALGYGVVGAVNRRAFKGMWYGLANTHPVMVLGVPVLAFWWWWSGVTARIGPELAYVLAKEQADNDLNLFQASSPLRNLEALAYGCGLGSILMLVGCAWWVRYRPAVRVGAAGIVMAAAWVGLSFAALSLFGKGVPRYLTPVWPGVAILAGAWVVRKRDPAEGPAGGRGGLALALSCAALGLGQAWWYGLGREVFEHERSPRALMQTLTRVEERGRFASFEFYTPALDYYAGSYVQPIVNAQMGVAVAGGPAWSLEELASEVRRGGPMVVLCRDRSLDPALASPVERMREAGLRVEPLELGAVFRIDNARTVVRAVRVEAF